MLFTVEIPESMAREIDRFVLEGRYPDHGALLRAALNNLMAEENHRDVPSSVGLKPRDAEKINLDRANQKGRTFNSAVAPEMLDPPEVEKARPLDYLALRLLPAKVIVSHLQKYLQKEGVPRANLAKFSVYVTQECVKLKSVLTQFDDSRDVKPSTGFPDPSPSSMQRYIHVYVGGRRGNVGHGIVASLGLVGFATGEDGQEEIGLTRTGFGLACQPSALQGFIHGETSSLPDPIFDDMEFEILTDSILKHSGESSLVKTIMNKLQEKDVGRTELNAVSKAHFEEHYQGQSISKNVVNTHTAATTLRLRELGIARGVWDKSGLLYQLTERGREWGKEIVLW